MIRVIGQIVSIVVYCYMAILSIYSVSGLAGSYPLIYPKSNAIATVGPCPAGSASPVGLMSGILLGSLRVYMGVVYGVPCLLQYAPIACRGRQPG
jgi:hypothetical protein